MENKEDEPTIENYIEWIDELVKKYGVELDYFAWERLKEELK